MVEPLLIQYQVLSEQRLHFGRLYWQSVAFLFALLLASLAILPGTNWVPLDLLGYALGGITILMGFVVDRVRKLEGQYEDRLEAIEKALQSKGHIDIQIAPKAGKYGARFVVTLGLYLLGAAIILLAVLSPGLPLGQSAM
ncbi:hypothetical protein WNY37_00160 [Henriciella sp. AS95]|uniref:hypothetical protein n=1 Tax=Henriciella sp. AS95 TaxID=3135782 RepID=UPI00316B3216